MATPRTVFNLDDPQVEFNRVPDSASPNTNQEDRLQQVQSILKQYSQDAENKTTNAQRVWSTAQKQANSFPDQSEILKKLDYLEKNVRQLSDIVSLLVDLRTR